MGWPRVAAGTGHSGTVTALSPVPGHRNQVVSLQKTVQILH
jgi:hypothetical protein